MGLRVGKVKDTPARGGMPNPQSMSMVVSGLLDCPIKTYRRGYSTVLGANGLGPNDLKPDPGDDARRDPKGDAKPWLSASLYDMLLFAEITPRVL